MWFESENNKLNELGDIIDELATIIQPVPVAVFIVHRNTVALVNDRHYTNAAPASASGDGSTNSHARDCPCARSSSTNPASESATSGNAEPPVQRSELPGASDQTPVQHMPPQRGPSALSLGDSHGRIGREHGWKDPENPVLGDPPAPGIPFIGKVLLQRAHGLNIQQAVELCIGLCLETRSPRSSEQGYMTTDITMDCLQLEVLVACMERTDGHCIDLDISLVRAVDCKLTLQPVGEQRRCDFFAPRPLLQDYSPKFTRTREFSYRATVVASAKPGVNLMFFKKSGITREHIGLAERDEAREPSKAGLVVFIP